MKKVIVFILGLILIGCNTSSSLVSSTLSIVGDIEEEIILTKDMLQEIDLNDENQQAISLSDVFEMHELNMMDYDVMFVANDSLTNVIEDSFDKVYLIENNNQWDVFSEAFPPTLRLKDLNRLIFMKKEITEQDSVALISSFENKMLISAGNFLSYQPETLLILDGISNKGENQMFAYQQKQVKSLDKLSSASNLLVLSNQGEHQYIQENHFLVLNKTSIDLMDKNYNVIIQDINGIIEDPPNASIMDVYYDVEYYLQNDQKVMVILIDGLGFHQFEHAAKNNTAPFITSFEPKMASSVFTPVTNAGLAAILTGKPPLVNGILNRDFREVKSESFFDLAHSMNKNSMLIEGNINILDINANVKLHLDTNNSGSSDDEIIETALEFINELDVMMVHFHSFDDNGHNYGPLDDKTMASLSVLDGYIEQLVNAWDGVSILVADHGMHQKDDGGYHGDVRFEDMFVPYIIIP